MPKNNLDIRTDSVLDNSTPVNWDLEFSALANGEKSPEDFEITQLFEMASTLAVQGKYKGKAKIYEEFILSHPKATEVDKIRVKIYQGDVIRRNGNPKVALETLSSLTIPPENPITQAEFLQDISECHLVLGDLPAARQAKEQIVAICQANQNIFPVDKYLYYDTGLIAVQLQQADYQPALSHLAQQKKLLDDLPSGAIIDYSFGSYYALSGEAYERQGNMAEALKNYQAYFDSTPAPGIKAVAALNYLYVAWQANSSDRTDSIMTLAKFFSENENQMQPTYIQALQMKYNFVKSIIHNIKLS